MPTVCCINLKNREAFLRNSEMANSTRTASSAGSLVKGPYANPMRTFSAGALGETLLLVNLWTFETKHFKSEVMEDSSLLTKMFLVVFFSAACLYRFFTLNNAWVWHLNNKNVDLFECEMVLIIKCNLYNRLRKQPMWIRLKLNDGMIQ